MPFENGVAIPSVDQNPELLQACLSSKSVECLKILIKDYFFYLHQMQKVNNSILMGTVHVNYLNRKNFVEYLSMIESEDIARETNILNNIKEIVVKNLDNLQLGVERKKEQVSEPPLSTNPSGAPTQSNTTFGTSAFGQKPTTRENPWLSKQTSNEDYYNSDSNEKEDETW